jgi:hypothetical protein
MYNCYRHCCQRNKMSDKDRMYEPLTSSMVKGLNDKLYDKRKAAALEIEKFAFV